VGDGEHGCWRWLRLPQGLCDLAQRPLGLLKLVLARVEDGRVGVEDPATSGKTADVPDEQDEGQRVPGTGGGRGPRCDRSAREVGCVAAGEAGAGEDGADLAEGWCP